jgi:hypothetical protein
MQLQQMAALAALELQIHSPEPRLLMVVAVAVQSEILLRDQPVLLQAVVAQVEKVQLEVTEVIIPVVEAVVVAQPVVQILSVAQAVQEL